MFERSFFLRETQLLAQAVGDVITKKKKKEYDEALLQLDKSLDRFFKTDTDAIRGMTEEEVVRFCYEEGQFFNEKGLPLADLLTEKADIMDDLDETESAIGWYQKALALYRAAASNPGATIPLDIYSKINRLQEYISDLKGEE